MSSYPATVLATGSGTTVTLTGVSLNPVTFGNVCEIQSNAVMYVSDVSCSGYPIQTGPMGGSWFTAFEGSQFLFSNYIDIYTSSSSILGLAEGSVCTCGLWFCMWRIYGTTGDFVRVSGNSGAYFGMVIPNSVGRFMAINILATLMQSSTQMALRRIGCPVQYRAPLMRAVWSDE